MIYEQPDFRAAGDRHVVVYFGDEMNIDLNFIAQGLSRSISERRLPGVIETVPHFASLMLHYDPDRMSLADLRRETLAILEEIKSGGGRRPRQPHDLPAGSLFRPVDGAMRQRLLRKDQAEGDGRRPSRSAQRPEVSA